MTTMRRFLNWAYGMLRVEPHQGRLICAMLERGTSCPPAIVKIVPDQMTVILADHTETNGRPPNPAVTETTSRQATITPLTAAVKIKAGFPCGRPAVRLRPVRALPSRSIASDSQ